ncbi:hypothetical protein BST45_12510 [Mycobacterium shinjukuense]|nr:hypothetical protein BST45_12510 [Mycobacterium shinjukuense]
MTNDAKRPGLSGHGRACPNDIQQNHAAAPIPPITLAIHSAAAAKYSRKLIGRGRDRAAAVRSRTIGHGPIVIVRG